jgi:hypothetical protein
MSTSRSPETGILNSPGSRDIDVESESPDELQLKNAIVDAVFFVVK